MKFNDLFPLVYVINMDSRPDRWDQIQSELSKLGIYYTRIPGIVTNESTDQHWNGIKGCYLSHKRCLELAQSQNKNVFIFEDDAQLINNYEEIIDRVLFDLSKFKWDMVYFGGNICNKINRITPNLGKLSHAQSTSSYGVNVNFISHILNKLDKFTKPIDLVYAEDIIPFNHCYISIPMVCVQRAGFSDIEGTFVDYPSWMTKRFEEQLK